MLPDQEYYAMKTKDKKLLRNRRRKGLESARQQRRRIHRFKLIRGRA